jgi:hypothetical protein
MDADHQRSGTLTEARIVTFCLMMMSGVNGAHSNNGLPGHEIIASVVALSRAVILLLSIFILIREPAKTWRHLWVSPLSVCMFAFVFASLAWNVRDDGIPTTRLFQYMTICLLGVYLTFRFSFDRIVKIIATALFVPIALSVPFSLAYPSIAFTIAGQGQFEEPVFGLTGLFSHKNVFGRHITWFMLMLLFVWGNRSIPRGLTLLVMAATSVMLYLTKSSTSIMAAAVTYLAFFSVYIMKISAPRLRLGIITAFLLIASAGSLFAVRNLENATRAIGKTDNLSGRIPLWEICAEYWQSRRPWFGFGYGGIWAGGQDPVDFPIVQEIEARTGFPVPHSHNGFLNVAMDLGYVGLALLMLELLHTLYASITVLVKLDSEDPRYLRALWPLVGLTYVVLNNLTEVTFQRENLVGLIFVVISYHAQLQKREFQSSLRSIPIHQRGIEAHSPLSAALRTHVG